MNTGQQFPVPYVIFNHLPVSNVIVQLSEKINLAALIITYHSKKKLLYCHVYLPHLQYS